MLMTKGLDSKILYSLLIVSGFVLTIGAASAVVMYSENIELDNGTGDSSVKVTSSTGTSKLLIEDQGVRQWSIQASNSKWKLDFVDESTSTLPKERLTIRHNGDVGIGNPWPKEKLDVRGNIHTTGNVDVDGNLNVDGVITGSYIVNLEATIAALEARIAALEASLAINEPMILTNEASIASNVGMISTHDTKISTLEAGTDPTVPMVSMVLDHGTMIDDNSQAIATNAAAIAAGGGGFSVCDTNSDGVIDAAEISAHITSLGIPITPGAAKGMINQVEGSIQNNLTNDVLDSDAEVSAFNVEYLFDLDGPC